jgi:hypothetical protein
LDISVVAAIKPEGRPSIVSAWIRDAADRLKRRRDEERRRLGKGPASGRALHSDAPVLWKKLAERLQTAAADFNKEFADDPLCPRPLHFEAIPSGISIATVYCNSGSPTFKLIATFLEAKAVVACSLVSSDRTALPVESPPAELQFRVSNAGRVDIYHGDTVVGIDEAVRLILEPLLDTVELIAY